MKTRSAAEKKYYEYELLKFYEMKKQTIKEHKLSHLMWETTTRCNAGCEHCSCSCDKNNKVEEVDTKYIIKMLDDIDREYGANNVFFVATGGEPLLRKGLFEVMSHATKLGYTWGMSTNGSLLTKSMVKKMKDTNILSVNISIDGLKDTHEAFRKLPGYWEKIWDGVKMLQEEPAVPVIQVTTCATKKNLNELEDLYKFLVSKGIKYWRVLSVDANGRAIGNDDILLSGDDYNYLFDFIESKNNEHKMTEVTYGCSNYLGPNLEGGRVREPYFFCMAGIINASILSNGDIYVCPNLPRRKELIQGNITKDNFMDVWNNKFDFFRDPNRQANKKCLSCYHWKYCLGGSLHTWDFDKKRQDFCPKEHIKNFE